MDSQKNEPKYVQNLKCNAWSNSNDFVDYDYGNEEEFSLLTNPLADCSCTNYINKYGFGNCTVLDLKPHKFHGKKVCYVDPPSNCPDLRGSVTNKGKQLSAMACKVNEEREVKDPSKVPTYLSGEILHWLHINIYLPKDVNIYGNDGYNLFLFKWCAHKTILSSRSGNWLVKIWLEQE